MTFQLVICLDVDQDTARVGLSGPLDAVNSNSLFAQVVALIHGGHLDLELDLSGVEAADPAGLGAVLAAATHAGAVGGSLHLCGVRPAVQEVMQQIGIGRFFTLCDDTSFAPDNPAGQGRTSGPAQRPNLRASKTAPPSTGRDYCRLVDTTQADTPVRVLEPLGSLPRS